MSDHDLLKHISSWVSLLANLTSAGREPVTERRIAAYATMLAGDLPAGAFTRESMRAVATEFFPAYEPLRRSLAEWWAKQQPAVPKLAGPGADLPDRERWMLQAYLRDEAAGWPEGIGWAATPEARRSNSRSLLKSHAALAYAELLRLERNPEEGPAINPAQALGILQTVQESLGRSNRSPSSRPQDFAVRRFTTPRLPETAEISEWPTERS